MNFNELKTPEELMEYMDKNIKYGWIDNDGNKHIDTLEDFREKYRTSSIDEILDTGIATCIGQAKLIKYFFGKMNIENKLYCYRAYEKDDNYNEKVKMHCFVLFKKDNLWYWFEHSMDPVKGIHPFNDIDSALDNITCKWKKGERELAEIDDIPDGLSYKEFNLYVNSFDKRVRTKTTI